MIQLVNIVTGRIVDNQAMADSRDYNRATGRTLGQALRLIGASMGNPGESIGIVDHHDASQGYTVTQGRVATEGLVYRMRELIKATKLRGFTISLREGKHSITYQPLVPLKQVVKEWADGQSQK